MDKDYYQTRKNALLEVFDMYRRQIEQEPEKYANKEITIECPVEKAEDLALSNPKKFYVTWRSE